MSESQIQHSEQGIDYIAIDDAVYEQAKRFPGRHTMDELARLAVIASQDDLELKPVLDSVRSQMGTSLTLMNGLVVPGDHSPAEMRGEDSEK